MVALNPPRQHVMHVSGLFITIFSVVVGLLLVFVIPSACSFLGGLQIVLLGLLLIAGLIVLLLAHTVFRNKRI